MRRVTTLPEAYSHSAAAALAPLAGSIECPVDRGELLGALTKQVTQPEACSGNRRICPLKSHRGRGGRMKRRLRLHLLFSFLLCLLPRSSPFHRMAVAQRLPSSTEALGRSLKQLRPGLYRVMSVRRLRLHGTRRAHSSAWGQCTRPGTRTKKKKEKKRMSGRNRTCAASGTHELGAKGVGPLPGM